MAPQIKLIATDLDGTLLDDSNQISEANTRVLRAAVEQGVTVCIATGRSHSSASQFVTELGIEDSLIISYNGAMIRGYRDAEPLHHVTLPADVAAEIVRYSVQQQRYLHYFLDDTLYVTHMSHWGRVYLARTGDEPVPVGDLRQFEGQSPIKLLISDKPQVISEILPEELERWEELLYVTHSLPEYIEYLHPQATKGEALIWLADHLQIGLEHTMALGDQLNDLPMIQRAGVGVAMPGSCEQVREKADYVASSAHDGVAEAVEHYLKL
jgi:Cof subfamily protein (haloacid dehalogenase superfamily)